MSRFEGCGVEYARHATNHERGTMIIMVRSKSDWSFSFLPPDLQAHIGLVRDRTDAFTSLRRQNVDRNFLEVSRLEKRLTRLTQLVGNLPLEQIQSGAGKPWPMSWHSDQRKAQEQSVVSWQDDSLVLRCPLCKQEFTSVSFRRHHCRTCGRVVCGDPATRCSVEVPLTVASRG